MSTIEIRSLIQELQTSIHNLQTSINTNVQATNQFPPPTTPPNLYSLPFPQPPSTAPAPHPTACFPTPQTPPNSPLSHLPIRRLSPAKIEELNDHGLCYNCEQIWSDTHRCRSKYLILLGTDEEDEFDDMKSPDLRAEVEITVEDWSNFGTLLESPPPLMPSTESETPPSLLSPTLIPQAPIGNPPHSPMLHQPPTTPPPPPALPPPPTEPPPPGALPWPTTPPPKFPPPLPLQTFSTTTALSPAPSFLLPLAAPLSLHRSEFQWMLQPPSIPSLTCKYPPSPFFHHQPPLALPPPLPPPIFSHNSHTPFICADRLRPSHVKRNFKGGICYNWDRKWSKYLLHMRFENGVDPDLPDTISLTIGDENTWGEYGDVYTVGREVCVLAYFGHHCSFLQPQIASRFIRDTNIGPKISVGWPTLFFGLESSPIRQHRAKSLKLHLTISVNSSLIAWDVLVAYRRVNLCGEPPPDCLGHIHLYATSCQFGFCLVYFWAGYSVGTFVKHIVVVIILSFKLIFSGSFITHVVGRMKYESFYINFGLVLVLSCLIALVFGVNFKWAEFCLDIDELYQPVSKGSCTFSMQVHGWQVSDCTARVLKIVFLLSQMPPLVGEKIETGRLYDVVNVILSLHSGNGGFSAWELQRAARWFEEFNPTKFFEDVPIEREYVECTASSVQGLALFKKVQLGHRRREMERCIANETKFIKEIQEPDDSWYGCWEICYTCGMWFGVEELVAVGKTYHNSPTLIKACEFLQPNPTSRWWME